MPTGGLSMFGAGLQLQQVTPGTANLGNANITGTMIATNFDTRTAPTASQENTYFGFQRTFGAAVTQGTCAFGNYQKVGGAGGFTPQFAVLFGNSTRVYCGHGTAVGDSAVAGVDRGDVNQSNPHSAFGFSTTASGDAADPTVFGNYAAGSVSAAIGRRVYSIGYSVGIGLSGNTDVIAIGSSISQSFAGLTNILIIRSGAATRILGPTDNNSIAIGEPSQTKVQIGPYSIGSSTGTVVTINDADHVMTQTEGTLIYATLAAARNVTLPAANAVAPGYGVKVADFSGSMSAVNTVTIVAAGADTIVGGISPVMAVAYGGRRLMSDGVSKWNMENNW